MLTMEEINRLSPEDQKVAVQAILENDLEVQMALEKAIREPALPREIVTIVIAR